MLLGLLCLLLVAGMAGAAGTTQVRAGTEVRLLLSQPLSSQTARAQQPIAFSVAQDVRAAGVVVIPEGTPAQGVVLRAKPNGVFGEPGELRIRIKSLQLNGRSIPLYGATGEKGRDADGGAVVVSALFGPLGVLVRGRNVELPAGTPVLAYIDADFEVPALAEPPLGDRAGAAPALPSSTTVLSDPEDSNDD